MKRATPFAFAVAALAFAAGCSDNVVKGQALPPPPERPPGGVMAAADAGGPVLKGPEYSENDFVESDRNRDPFRSYLVVVAPTGPKTAVNQRLVKLGQYSIDELKLVAIVLAGDGGRAMFLPMNGGKGQVLTRGNYVGRPETVRVGGATGQEYQLNWRVERIRDGEVVLIREDPAQPAIPPATRVITLHPEQEKEQPLGEPG